MPEIYEIQSFVSKPKNPLFSHFSVNLTKEKARRFFSRESMANMATQTLIVFLFWGSLWGLFKSDAAPNGYIFNTCLVVLMAHICGKIMQLFNLPPLIGMIVIGFLLNNRDQFGNYSKLQLNDNLKRVFRQIALSLVLIRAGLELDKKKLTKMPAICIRLSFIPCIVEAVTIICSTYYLIDFPWQWGCLLGFMMSAVSPAVIVPPILALMKSGFGNDKGIPTLLLASVSIDDILALMGFGLGLKLIFMADLNTAFVIFKVMVEPIIGIMTGLVIGLTLWYVPSADSSETEKFCLLVSGGMAAEFMFTSTEMRAAGPEACFMAAFVASWKWRLDRSYEPIEKDLKDFWTIIEPILFGLVGTELRVSDMTDIRNDLIIGFFCVFIAVIMRFFASISVIFGNNLNIKEKIFIGFAWLPKATLQMAVCPIVLELANKNGDELLKHRAQLVVHLAFLAVLLTTPLGALAINILGPNILNKANDSTEKTIQLKDDKTLVL